MLIIKPVWWNIYERHVFYLSIIFLKLIKLCVELAFITQRIIWPELLFGLSKMWISIILQPLSTAHALISIYEDIHFKFTKIHEVENITDHMNEPVKKKNVHMSERLCLLKPQADVTEMLFTVDVQSTLRGQIIYCADVFFNNSCKHLSITNFLPNIEM